MQPMFTVVAFHYCTTIRRQEMQQCHGVTAAGGLEKRKAAQQPRSRSLRYCTFSWDNDNNKLDGSLIQ